MIEPRCSGVGKIIYPTMVEANRTIRMMHQNGRFGREGRPVPFKCAWCGGWHIGRPQKRFREFGRVTGGRRAAVGEE